MRGASKCRKRPSIADYRGRTHLAAAPWSALPRWPLYVIPRGNNLFMLGATSLECEDDRVSVRSALELLSAAYAVHPTFAEARIVEFGAGLRPAFPDHLPHIAINGDQIGVNGL